MRLVLKTRPMYFTGIDVSLTDTGLAILDRAGKPIFVKSIKTKAKDGDMARILQTSATISKEIYSNTQIMDADNRYVFIEDYGPFKKSGKLMVRAELVGIVKFLLHDQYDVYMINPRSLKAEIAGHGGASKDDMARGVYAKFGFSHDNENVIDAFALAQYGRRFVQHDDRLDITKLC